MKKISLAIIISLLMADSLPAQTLSIGDIRSAYAKAIDDSGQTDQLYEQLLKAKTKSPLVTAYQGATESLKARYTWNPYNKMTYLKKAQASFEKAVEAAPTDIEVRFLRFSVFHYLPKFLVDSQVMESDKQVILGNLNKASTDTRLRQVIAQFMISSGRCSPDEEDAIRQLLSLG